jgi:tRNA threonylcarbamoyl adenosine modification protein (Sua5/YciO/YrdC/YwlC family)
MGTDTVGSDTVRQAVDAIRAGEPVLLPTDGVYGLCAYAYREAPARRLYRLKGRVEEQPTALLAASMDMLFECVPELRGRAGVIARTLLPGPYTLVLSNPAQRYRWLNGGRPDTIGVRVVADLPTPSQHVLDAVGAVVATSANEPGGPPPASLDEVPELIRSGCTAEIDAGRLSGQPSTVIDFTGPLPLLVRQGAGDAEEAIARVREALAASSAS